jgi:hypothetical protein
MSASAIITPPPVAAGPATLHQVRAIYFHLSLSMSDELKTDKVQYGEAHNAHPSNFTEGVAGGEAPDDAGRRIVTKAAFQLH